MTPQIGPHGYLVLRRHDMYDLPVRFFWDRDDAIEYCDNLPRSETEGILNVLNIEPTEEISVIVIHFVNGKPLKIIHDKVYC